MHRLLVAAFSLLATLAILPAQAQEKRVALVIGMGEYQHLASLNNPVPDAKAVAASLKAHGFEVSEHYNLPRADLLDVLETFKREAAASRRSMMFRESDGAKAVERPFEHGSAPQGSARQSIALSLPTRSLNSTFSLAETSELKIVRPVLLR